MEESPYIDSEKMETIKDFLKVNGIDTYLLVGIDKKEQVVAIGQGHREDLTILLTVLMYKDEKLMAIFAKALQAARAEQTKHNFN
jgi:hypothetical protein